MLAFLCFYDIRVGNLVMPTLFVRVEQNPNESQVDDEPADDIAHETYHGFAGRHGRPIDGDHFDRHDGLAGGLSVPGPKVNVIAHHEHKLHERPDEGDGAVPGEAEND